MDLQEGGTRPEPLCLSTSLQVRSMTRDNEVCSKEGDCKKKIYWVPKGRRIQYSRENAIQNLLWTALQSLPPWEAGYQPAD